MAKKIMVDGNQAAAELRARGAGTLLESLR